MQDLLAELRQTAEDSDDLVVVDREQFELRPLADRGHLGRWIRCGDEAQTAVLDQLLVPGLLLTRDIGELVVVFVSAEGEPSLVVRGHPDDLIALVEGVRGFRFVITPPDASWRIIRFESHLRVEGAPTTKFFPWSHVLYSLGVGGIVSALAAIAVAGDGVAGPSAAAPPGWFGLPRLQILQLAAVPGVLAAATNFASLCWLGPSQARPLSAWLLLAYVSVVATVGAVGMAFLHYPLLGGR